MAVSVLLAVVVVVVSGIGGIADGSLTHEPVETTAVGIDLQCVDDVGHSIQQQTPADDDERGAGNPYGTQDGYQSDNEHCRRTDPKHHRDAADAAGGNQIDNLIDGAEDEYGSEDISQSVHDEVGAQSQQQTEDDAADTDDGEGWGAAGDNLTVGVKNRDSVVLAAGTDVDGTRNDTGQQEQYPDGDDEPYCRVGRVFDEQHSDDDGTCCSED